MKQKEVMTSNVDVKQKVGRGFFICLLASLLVSYQFMVQITPELMVDKLANGLDLSFAQVGFLSSAMFYSYLLLQGPCGVFAQRIGPRASLLIAALGIPVSCIIFAYSHDYYMAIAGRFLAGAFAAPCVVSCFILGSRWLPEHLFASLCGIVEMMGMLGAAVGPILISSCLVHYGWQRTMLLIAGTGFVLLFFIFFFIKNYPRLSQKDNLLVCDRQSDESQACESQASSHVQIKGFASLKVLFSTPGYLSYCFFGFFTFAILNSFGGLWLIPFAKVHYPMLGDGAGLLVTFTFAGAAVGILSVSVLSASVSARKLMLIGTSVCFMVLSAILFIPLSFRFMLILSFVMGVSTGVYLLPFVLIKKKVPQELCGLALGVANAILISSGLIFQPMIGWLLNVARTQGPILSVQNYQVALLPLLVGLLMAIGLAARVKKQVKRKKQWVAA